jgi:hypothetical protein
LFLSSSAANAGIMAPFDPSTKALEWSQRFQDLLFSVRSKVLLRVSSVLGVFAFNGLHLKTTSVRRNPTARF